MVRWVSVVAILGASGFAVADPLQLDGGLVVGFPTALPTGLSRGIGVGASLGAAPLRLGVRAAWVTATEATTAWEVTNSDVHLRATAGLEEVAGRGTIGLRLGVGGTLVHETRMRAQGMRAGLTGDELETSALALVPAADLDLVVGVQVYGAWRLALSGGPSIAVIDGEARASWTSQIGVGWQR